MGRRTAQIGAIGVAIGITVAASDGKAAAHLAAGVAGGRAVKDPEPLSVGVVVDDRATVAPVVLDHAEKEVARIHLHAGLKTVWSVASALADGSPSENRPPPAAGFTVRLIIQAAFLGHPPETSEFLM